MLYLKDVAQIATNRTKLDKDIAIAITGTEGEGKSALSIGLGLEIDPLFEIKRNVLFSPTVKEITDKIYSLPPYTPIIADEAIKIMYKLNWGQKIQRYLNTVYALCRKQNKISIFNLPRFTDASEYFRNHRIRLWIHIIDGISNQKQEGYAVLMSRSWNPIGQDVWGMKTFDKEIEKGRKRRKMDAEYDLEDRISLFETMPTFVGAVKFKWVSPHIWEEYEAEKLKVKLDDELDLMGKGDKQLLVWKQRAFRAIKAFKTMGYTNKSIAKFYSVENITVASWLREIRRTKETKELNEPKQITS